jgi:dTDP-glucose 4,6-dehydratase
MNLIGETQDPEKFVPKLISRILNGQEVSLHVGQDGIIGSRAYLHARALADAVLFLIKKGNVSMYSASADVSKPDRYNVAGDQDVDNLEMAQIIAKLVGKPLKHKFEDAQLTRPGHDLRYALDGTKLSDSGWKSPRNFMDSLRKMIKWTIGHALWQHVGCNGIESLNGLSLENTSTHR